MIQEITVPEKTWEFSIPEIDMVIQDPANVKARIHLGKREVASTNNFVIAPKSVNITQVITDQVALGNLTAADVQGFKKCIKAICAKGFDIAYENTNDVL